jgi:hypothetical protein
VTYQVRFAGPALRQLDGLPKDAFDALVDRVVILLDEPWDATVMWPGNDPAYRETAFGAGLGFISFHADDTAELIRVFRIVWAGLRGPRHPAEKLVAVLVGASW